MSLLPEDLDGLAAFFDPAAVAGIMKDIFDSRHSPVNQTACPAKASVAAVSDQEMLRCLLPQDVYGYWKNAGYSGQYCMTFMLRHAMVFLSLASHGLACPDAGLLPVFKKYFSVFDCGGAADYASMLTDSSARALGRFPVVGFSALGMHLLERPAGACRAFDFYGIGSCAEKAEGLFCKRHSSEAWWLTDEPGASTQADMFSFYGNRQNLHAFDERELEELVGRFWSRMKHFSRQDVTAAALAEALAAFGYEAVSELVAHGQAHLRRRYIERARAQHPDSGGGHEVFIRLKKYYDMLLYKLSS